MRKNYDIKTTQMNENFENLIYKKFWTEDVIKEWKEMIPNRQVMKNEYKKGFAAILYVLGVYKNNNMLIGNKFSNGYSIKHCPKEFLNSAIRTSHMNLLAFHKLEENWNKYKHLRVFIFWAAKKKEITNYCYLTKPLPEPEPEPEQKLENNKNLYINKNQNSNFISSEKRFKLLCEYTEKELPKLTFSKLYDLMKKRSNFVRSQLSKSDMELETDSSKSSVNGSENTSESSDNSNSNFLIKINNKNINTNSGNNNKNIINKKNNNSNNNSNKRSNSIDYFFKINNIKTIKDNNNNSNNKTKLLPNVAVNKGNNEKIEKEIICISSDEETNDKSILDDHKINTNNDSNTKNNTKNNIKNNINHDNNCENKEKIISKNIIKENEKKILSKNEIEPIENSQNNKNEKNENISNRKNDIVDFSQKIGNKENDSQLIDNSEKCGNTGNSNSNINNSISKLKRKQISDNIDKDNKKLKHSNVNDINDNKACDGNLQKLIGQKDSIIESKKEKDFANDTYNNKNKDENNIINIGSNEIKENKVLNQLDTNSNGDINNKKNNISTNNIKELEIETTTKIELKDNSKPIFEETTDENRKEVEDNDNIIQEKMKMKEKDIENKNDNENDPLTEQDYEIRAKENKEYFEFLHMKYNKLIKIHSHNRRRTSYIYNYIKKAKLEKTFFECDPEEIKKLLHNKILNQK